MEVFFNILKDMKHLYTTTYNGALYFAYTKKKYKAGDHVVFCI